MKRRAALGALGLMTALAACRDDTLPPLGQVILEIDTDAPVPAPPGVVTTTPPLLDRLRIEVYGEDGVTQVEARDFALHSGLFTDRKVSVGIVPAHANTKLSAKVWLYRSDREVNGLPPADTSLATTVTLPPTMADGIVEANVFLGVDSLGQPVTSTAASAGAVAVSRVGTWAGAARRGCAHAAAEGEVCVPSGAFWFGDPALRGDNDSQFADERLVTMSAFFMDAKEVTVADFRKVWPMLSAKGVIEPTLWNGAHDGLLREDWCNWTRAVTDGGGVNENLPVNCITWNTAFAYCDALGKTLASEVQFEYVASGLGRELGFPWGEDPPDCNGAIWARAGFGVNASYPGDCRVPGTFGGPTPPASAEIDVVTPDSNVASGKIFDLGGNISEWARDGWALPSDPFWSAVHVYADPIVPITNAPDESHPVRGGSWGLPSRGTRSALRLENQGTSNQLALGLRCVRSDR